MSLDIVGGNAPYTVVYNDGSTDITIPAYDGGPITVTPSITTTYTLINVSDACGNASVSGSAEITVFNSNSFNDLFGNTTICNGESTDLSFNIVEGLAPYMVTYNDGNSDITINGYNSGDPITVNPITTTIYLSVSVVDANGCNLMTTTDGPVTVEVLEGITSATLSGDNTICLGESSVLVLDVVDGNYPFTVIYNDGTNDITLLNYDGWDIIETPAVTTTYTLVSVSDDCGPSPIINGTATITVNDPPSTATLSGSTTICIGESTDLSLDIVGGNAPYTVVYNDGSTDITIPAYDGGPITVTPSITTTYTLINVSDACGNASVSGSATITVFSSSNFNDLMENATICSGGSTNLFFNIVEGAPPYTVTFNEGNGDIVISNYYSGDIFIASPVSTTSYFSVSVVDYNGCSLLTTTDVPVIVEVIDGITSASISGDNSICSGMSTDLTLDIIGGSAPYTVVYNDGTDDITIPAYDGGPITVTPTVTTTYTLVSLSDVCGSSSLISGFATITVTDPPPITATLSGSTTICNGESADLTLDIVDGNAPYTVEYTDGMDIITIPAYDGGPITVTPSNTTTYTLLSVSDICSNASVSGNAVVTVFSSNTYNDLMGNATICTGESTDLFFNIIEGLAPYIVTYNDGNGNIEISDYNNGDPITVSPITTTTYLPVSVIDANGCNLMTTTDGPVTVEVIGGITSATLSGDNTICLGGSSVLVLDVVDGNFPFTVIYNDGTNDITIMNYNGLDIIETPSVTTTYTLVSVSDGCGLSPIISGTATITVIDPPSTATFSGSTTICAGESADLILDIIGGTATYTVEYSDGMNIINIPAYDGEPITVAPSNTTTYTLLSVADACGNASVSGNAVVTVFSSNTYNDLMGNATICTGESTDLFFNIIEGLAPYIVTYNDGNGNIEISDYNNGDPITVSPITTTTYLPVSVIDANGCNLMTTTDGPVTVEVIGGITSATLSGDNTICLGGSSVLVLDVVDGNFPFTVIYNDGTNDITIMNYNGLDIIETPSVTTTYTLVSVIDGCGLSPIISGTATIAVNDPPSTATLSGTTNICSGESADLTFDIVGGNAPFTIIYNNGTTDITINNFNGAPISVTPNNTTTYTLVSVSDACGNASVSGMAIVTISPFPTITITNQGCSSDLMFYFIELISSGAAVTSSAGNVTFDGTNYIITDIPIDVNISIFSESELGGCITEIISNSPDCDCEFIDQPISEGDKSICENQDIPELSVTVGDNQTADWYNEISGGVPILIGSTSFTPPSAGTFYAEARDISDDCVSNVRTGVTLIILQNPNPIIIGDEGICLNQTTSVLGTSITFSSYQWSTEETTSMVTVSQGGIYSVIVTDENGCTSSDEIEITENPIPQPEINGDLMFCYNGSSELSANMEFSSYLWNSSENTQSIIATETGTYALTVTNEFSCTSETTISIEERDEIIPIILGDDFYCAGGSTLLEVEDSYESYLWSDNSTKQNLEVSEKNTYTLTVTDDFGCSGHSSIIINQIEGTTFTSNILVNSIACVGDTVYFFDISDNEAEVTSYLWEFGDESSSDERDPYHIYTEQGTFDVYLTAFDNECGNTSQTKQIEIFDCRQSANENSNIVSFNVFPNPTSYLFNIDVLLFTEMDVKIELFDIRSILLETRTRKTNHVIESFENWNAGIYYLKVTTSGYSQIKKVLVVE